MAATLVTHDLTPPWQRHADLLEFLKKNPALQRRFAAGITHAFRVNEAEKAMATVDAGQAGKAVFVRK